MWLSAVKLALNAGTHIYKKRQETKMAMALSPSSKDAMLASIFKGGLAEIYTIIGEHDMALNMIENFLTESSSYNWNLIKYHHD